ncbi:hypothetical protein [Enterococcus mundtii]|uniref:hypothetical protein n=1 Tax=Enterococcus mundtii TaxID=53346 RepID=UPI000F7CFAE9|nr:hypothetical protein [Enterococcus mundtii]AZP91661.1 hypothetical protein CYK55_00330 [Enterococcus mundtii]QCJ57901.1 hypothetical protein DDJ96_15015 [Enterococcus mundtii]QCJ57907.1 hypothetical protein DDJ96_15060 [Enterococcus mundtii]
MEENTFNETQFSNFIFRLIKDYQEGELTEYKRGAVSALLQVSDQFQKMVIETSSTENLIDLRKGEYLDTKQAFDRD